MAETLRLYCAINEDGDAQNPAAGVEMRLNSPDGTVHTAWGGATQDAAVGTGAYYVDFTIADGDDSGVYSAFFRTTTDGASTPIGTFPVSVR